ncbi:nucleotidyl transferase AbiEii/AbiGii toxin family protein [Rhodococcus baikonurensis]|uniref:Nucleotidyl transferase AbiEii/AbiGii toxin family protein n=2 Tax=Rhodococcus baikonurensis TaxID=172041 RepID=A0ABV5XAM5_9NOCA
MTRFLTRVFTADPDGWVLKGGTGMMIRLPEARYSRDVDLMSTAETPIEDVVDILQEILRANPIDIFSYTISRREQLTDEKGMKLTVTVSIGAAEYQTFKIDLVSHRGLIGEIETHDIPQIIDLDDGVEPGAVRVYPLADQIADKLCAMFEFHLRYGKPPPGDTSSRYRDLIDLLLLCQNLPIDLGNAIAAVEYQRVYRGGIRLPDGLHAPGPDWYENWTEYAADSPLDDTLHDLDTALTVASGCYNRILSELPVASKAATWDPAAQKWIDIAP